jgi:hypothetical protein
MTFCRVAAIQISCHPALTFALRGCGIAPEVLTILWTQQRCSVVFGCTCCRATALSTVPTGQIQRNRLPLFFQALKKISLAVRVLVEPIHDAKKILIAVRVGTNNHRHTLTTNVSARVEVGTIMADAGLAISRQLMCTLRFIFVSPSRFQPYESRSR